MAVYTRVEPGEVEAWLAGYGVGPLQALEPIAQGIENSNYRVDAGGAPFVLTLFEHQSASAVEGTLRLTLELSRRGVPCPRPLEAAGRLVTPLHGRPAALVPFVAGEVVWSPDEPHLEALGRCLARLHLAGAGVAFARRGPHLGEVLIPLARRLARSLEGPSPDLAWLLRDEATWQGGVAEEGLPTGVVHGDFFRDNVLFESGRPVVQALLDFHMAGRGPWLYDVAVVLLDAGWGPDGILGDRARALLRGYRAVRPLEGREYLWLPEYLRRAALRFLCLRLERAAPGAAPMAAGQAKDPLEFAARLRALRAGARAGAL